MAVLAAALVFYVFDCTAIATPEQAMECCKSMPCSSHGQDDQDCCKTMPTMHALFVQPSSSNVVSPASVPVAVLRTDGELLGIECFARAVAAHSHAPPILSLAAVLPLRI